MPLNPKALKTTDIQQAYDVVVAHLEAHPQQVATGIEPHDSAVALVEDALRAINHARRGDAHALLTSRRAVIARQPDKAAQMDTLSPDARAFAQSIIGHPAPQDSTPDHLAAPSTRPDLSALDGPVQAVAGTSASMAQLLDLRDTLRREKARAADILAQTTPTGAPYTAPESSDTAAIPTAHVLVPAIDTILATLLPGETWAGLLGEIMALEADLAKAAEDDTARRKAAIVARTATPEVPALPVADAAAAYPASAIPTIDATVRLTERKASGIFPQAYGASMALLGFDVPTMAFDAPHPDVPAIDPSYKFYVPVLVEALQAIAENDILWIYGDSGCGKSEFWKQLAAYLGMPYTRLNMDGHLTRGDIIGVNRIVPNAERQMEMRFIDGILPRAMARPGLLLIDELDLGDPEIMAVLQPVLEGEPLRILEDHGRVVRPHPLFRIGVTGNTTGLGPDSNAYLNAFEQSAATRDRIAAFVKMPYMTPAIEKKVLQERMPGVDEAFLDNLIALANKVREAYDKRHVNQIFSTRATQAAARRYARVGGLYPSQQEAVLAILETVILNRMDAPSRNVTKGLIDSIFV